MDADRTAGSNEQNSSQRIPLGLVVLLIPILVWAVISGRAILVASEADQRSVQQRAEAYEVLAREGLAALCGASDSPTFAGCVRDLVRRDVESDIAARDLAAQKGMERWAHGAFWIAVAALIATVSGIYYVRRTLKAGLEANEIAKRAGEKQLRGYLLAEMAHATFQRVDVNGGYHTFTVIELRNGGMSPVELRKVSMYEITNINGPAGGRGSHGEAMPLKVGPGATYRKPMGGLTGEPGRFNRVKVGDNPVFQIVAGIRYTYVDNLGEEITEEAWFTTQNVHIPVGPPVTLPMYMRNAYGPDYDLSEFHDHMP